MDLDKINQFNEQQRLNKEKAQEDAKEQALTERITKSVADSTKMTTVAVQSASKKNAEAVKEEVKNSGQKVVQALQESNAGVTDALNNLVLATVISKDPQVIETAQALAGLLTEISKASGDFKGSKLNLLPVANEKLAKSIDSLASKVTKKPDKDYSPELEAIRQQLASLDFNVQPIVNVPETKLDITPVVNAVKQLSKSIGQQKAPNVSVDLDSVVKGLSAVNKTIANQTFPAPNYVLPFSDITTGASTQQEIIPFGNGIFERISNTNGTSTNLTVFDATTTRNFIRGYSITNTSSSAGYVDFRDGSSGTVLWTVPIPATGGANVMSEEPIFWTSTNTALAYDVSAALTTVYISVTGFKG